LTHAVAVSAADLTDRKGALQALERCKPNLAQVQSLLADGGYVGEPFAQGVRDILDERVTVQIARRSELHTFKVMPKRWVVERRFAWLDKNRRLWRNCERLLNTSLQFIHLAFLALLPRRSSTRSYTAVSPLISGLGVLKQPGPALNFWMSIGLQGIEKALRRCLHLRVIPSCRLQGALSFFTRQQGFSYCHGLSTENLI
jgi:transposase